MYKIFISTNCSFCFTLTGTRVININISANEATVISSPLYPRNYPINIDYTWILKTEEHFKILIQFSSFDTEMGFDLFTAGNGVSSVNNINIFFMWSGTRDSPSLLSSENSTWLRFTSNGRATSSGFSLMALSVPPTGLDMFVYELTV